MSNLYLSSLIEKNKKIIEIDKNLYRPAEVDLLIGDSSKIRKILNWKPLYTLNSLIDDMIDFQKKHSDLSF